MTAASEVIVLHYCEAAVSGALEVVCQISPHAQARLLFEALLGVVVVLFKGMTMSAPMNTHCQPQNSWRSTRWWRASRLLPPLSRSHLRQRRRKARSFRKLHKSKREWKVTTLHFCLSFPCSPLLLQVWKRVKTAGPPPVMKVDLTSLYFKSYNLHCFLLQTPMAKERQLILKRRQVKTSVDLSFILTTKRTSPRKWMQDRRPSQQGLGVLLPSRKEPGKGVPLQRTLLMMWPQHRSLITQNVQGSSWAKVHNLFMSCHCLFHVN